MTRILISALLISCGCWAQDAATLAKQAVTQQQAGNYADAARSYAELEKLIPNDVVTRVNYGVVLVHLNRFAEAIEQYQVAEKLLPDDPRIELNLALVYAKSGNASAARKRFESLHGADPENAQVTMLLADACLQNQEYSRVIDLLQPLKDSSDLGVAYMLGTALLRTQHAAEAQAYVDRVAGNGDTPEARFLLGIEAYESRNFPEAVKQLSAAAEKNSQLPGVESMLGRSLLYTGDPDSAGKAFDAALATNPKDAGALLAKAEILTARKQDKQALPMAREALRLEPEDPETEITLAELLLRGGAAREAQPLAEKSVLAMSGDEHAHRVLASIYRAEHLGRKADREEAIADAVQAKADPGPAINADAPDFSLPDAKTGKPVRLAEYRGKRPVALIFGSYSCPNFRDSAETLKALERRYGTRVPFLLVYIREAHADGQWESARNTRADIAIAPAATMTEKEAHASMCSRKLHLPFPALVDGVDGKVEAAYNAWPSRAYIIDKEGRVAYSSRLSELDFQPDRMEAVLRKLSQP